MAFPCALQLVCRWAGFFINMVAYKNSKIDSKIELESEIIYIYFLDTNNRHVTKNTNIQTNKQKLTLDWLLNMVSNGPCLGIGYRHFINLIWNKKLVYNMSNKKLKNKKGYINNIEKWNN